MNEKLAVFSAIKIFYESGNDLIQVFAQLFLLFCSEDRAYSVFEIKEFFLSQTEINMPDDVIFTIAKRLKKAGSIDYKNLKDPETKSIFLTAGGTELRKKIEQDYEVANREKNALLKSLRSYVESRGAVCDDKILEQKLNEFIEHNLNIAISGLGHDIIEPGTLKSEICLYILDYFSETERSDPENFKRLKAILYGKIIAAVFLGRTFDKGAKIENLDIYLDTNIVFSLLELHMESYSRPVREVIDLIIKAGGRLKIFSFTKEEIVIKLSGYLKNYGDYSSLVPVHSIYYVLKQKGYSKSQVLDLIENIETKLNDLGIAIDYSFETESLLSNKSDEMAKLWYYKPNSYPESIIKHDLAAIYAIKKLRKGTVAHWEKSKCIFLTADFGLIRYNHETHYKDDIYTFPEVVHRIGMASMFWLKGQAGSDNVFVHNFLANFVREKVVSSDLWNRFIAEIKKKRDAGAISDSDIENLISFSETEKILIENKEKGIEILLDDFKIAELRKVSTKRDSEDSEGRRILAEQQKRIIEQGQQLMSVSSAIEKEAKDVWSKRVNLIVIIAIIMLFVVVFFVSDLFQAVLIVVPPFIVFIFDAIVSVFSKKRFSFLNFFIEKRCDFENKMIAKYIKAKKEKYLPHLENNK
jgi:hypothetical protein